MIVPWTPVDYALINDIRSSIKYVSHFNLRMALNILGLKALQSIVMYTLQSDIYSIRVWTDTNRMAM
jgi:hypothetical protein